MKRSYQFTLIAAILIAVVAISACSPAPAAPGITASSTIPEITIKAQDYAYSAPAQIQSGLVAMTLVNDGKEDHHAQLARLNEGVTMDQLKTALQGSPDAALALVSLAGGPSVVSPGKSQKVTLNLAAGNYVFLCFVSGQDNVPHLAKGMISPLQVAAAPAGAAGAPPAGMAEPKADGTVTLKDFAIQVPTDLKAGPQILKVTNAGPEPHEFTVLKMAAGKTEADFMAFMQKPDGPPPFESAGGMQGVSSGVTAWAHMDFTPGTYVALCFIPSPKEGGKAHVELGMMTAFTVK